MYRGSRITPRVEIRPTCTRCGVDLGKADRPDGLCASCTAEPPVEYVAYTRGGRKVLCKPWDGDFDDADNPVDPDGRPVMPGRRTCGHSDCVNAAHVRRPYTSRAVAA